MQVLVAGNQLFVVIGRIKETTTLAVFEMLEQYLGEPGGFIDPAPAR